jgi:effector-binding domain-containing protein
MFKISEFSKLSRVPAKTLRYYDELQLFCPAHVDRFTGYRYYAADQLPRLNRILALKDMGLSLSEIARLVNEQVSAEELWGMFRLKEAELQQEVVQTQARLRRVATRLKQIEQEGKMPDQDVVIKQIEPMRVLFIRQIAPTPDHVGIYLGECIEAMQAAGAMPVAPPMTIFYDEEFKEAEMDIATVIPVTDAVKQEVPIGAGRTLTVQTLPGLTRAACIIHHGSYDALEQTYAVIGRWIADNGYRLSGNVRELYLTAPSPDQEPVTEIQFPIE